MKRKLLIVLPSIVLTAILLFALIPSPISATDKNIIHLKPATPLTVSNPFTNPAIPATEPSYQIGDTSIGAIDYEGIDNTFEPALVPWDWQMLGADYHLRVKEDFTSGQIMEFEFNDSTVQLQPMALEWSNNLSQIQIISIPQDVTPIVTNPDQEGTIVWNDAYGSNIDFEWKSTPIILNKTLTISSLSDLPAPQQYIVDGGSPFLRLNLIFAPSTDLDIYVDGNKWDKATKVQTFNDIEFRKGGETLWSFMPLMYWDSAGNEGQSVATLEKSGNKLYISVRVPYSWLQAASYPVYVDADIQIEGAASTNQNLRALRGGPFWTDNLTGYVVYLDANHDLVYSKTEDGGANWSDNISIVAAAACDAVLYDCWADWQTAGDAGTKIHIVYQSLDTEEIRYVYLDTSGDSVAGDDLIETCQGSGTFSGGTSLVVRLFSITKTRGGNFAVAIKYWDDSNTPFNSFYTSPDAATWTSRASPYTDEAKEDYCLLFPGNEADNQDVWGIYWDADADEISLKTFDDSDDAPNGSWSAGTSISGSMIENTTYIQMDGAIRLSDGHLRLFAWNLYDNVGADLMNWDINGEGSITAKTNVLTDSAETFLVSVLINQDNDDEYVAYARGGSVGLTTTIYYKKSDDGGATWSGETAMQADAADDERWISAGAVKAAWGGKFQPVWFNDDTNVLYTNVTNGISIAAAEEGVVAPTVTSDNSSSVEETTAILSGNITATGGENADYHGAEWGTSTGVYTANATTGGSFAAGVFTANATGLSPGTTYYWRAMAHNSAGWGYGSELYLTTKPQAPTSLTDPARLSTQITLTWTLGTGSENTTIRYRDDGSYPTDYADGTLGYSGTASTCNITGLSPSIQYHIGAWAVNTDNVTLYSDASAQVIAWTRPGDATSANTSNPTYTTLDLDWTKGASSNRTHWRWDTGDYPANVAAGTQGYFGTANTTTVESLPVGTLIYFNGWAYSDNSTYYSSGNVTATGTTAAATAPTVTTANATDILSTSATMSGNITATNGQDASFRGFEWGLISANYTDNQTSAGSFGVGVFTEAVAGLSANTTYYYRAMAYNDGGWGYGGEVSFITLEAPGVTVETTPNPDVDGTSVTLAGNITDTGDGTCDDRGFVYGTTSYTDPGDTASDSTAYDSYWNEEGSFSTGAFSHEVTGLTALTVYYFRAFASNDGTWAYGDEYLFFAVEDGKVYLELRPDLDETGIVKKDLVPTNAWVGLFHGYSLPIWVSDNESLYFLMCVPDRWDGESDIVIHFGSALANADESGNAYRLELAWERATPNVDVLPGTTNLVYIERQVYSDTQFQFYQDWASFDYDVDADDPLIADDLMAIRVRRVASTGQNDLAGELIFTHMGILFARGDLLGSPDDVIMEEDMEELGTQFGVFNTILEGWGAYFLIGFGLLFIIGLSVLAFWRPNPVLFMIVAGASLILGFYWYDAFTTNLGLSLGLMMMAYALVCLGYAFRCIFWRDRLRDEG